MIFVWFHCYLHTSLSLSFALTLLTFECACVFAYMLLFHHFVGSRNCLLDYICFSNWYIVIHGSFFLFLFYSGLLILHFNVFVCVTLVARCCRAFQMSLHANMTYLLWYNNNNSNEIFHTHIHKQMGKKCGKIVAYFISIITIYREFIVRSNKRNATM